jgi:formate hydrogenlyase subunit 3/multisubunit Na+/H+ antiporter MnhD subunit
MNSVLQILPLLAVLLPAALLLACLCGPVRRAMPGLLWLAPLPALAAAIFARGTSPLVLDWPPYRLILALDAPGAMLLGTSALLWIAAGAFCATFFRGTPLREKFAVCWLLTLTGCLGIFLAADLGLFLFFYALVSLPAYGMITHDGTASSRRAGSMYIGFALVGEGVLLLAFVLLVANVSGGNLRITDVVAALPTAPNRSVILALLIVGFGMKMALLPLHVWLPLAHAAAPMPASAVLSGAVVKVGVIGLIRFLPFETALPAWGTGLAVVGLLTAFFGVAIGITQSNPKSMLAYSSVSQMGFLAAVLGMGVAAGDAEVANVAAFYAAHHVIVKGALFLAIGVASASGRVPRFVIWPAAVIGLGLAGLPLTGGALAKFAAKGPLGYGTIATLATWSAAGTALLMLHFLQRLARTANADAHKSAPFGLVGPWLVLVVAAVAVPWAIFPLSGIASVEDVLDPKALWKALGPLLVGGVLAIALRRFGKKLPQIPNGDIAALGGTVSRAAAPIGKALERADDRLKQWPVAGLSLVVLVILLVVTMWK